MMPTTWLHRFAKLLAAATLVLIAAGGLVTSTGSGLSVPDWPTTYGWSMFTFPLSKWVGGIVYEHGHRLIASTVGMLTIVLVVWTWMKEKRLWIRALSFIALLVVITQGILGGITVLLQLPPAVSIGHAGLAQLFFCTVVSLALFTSPGWMKGYGETQGSKVAADGTLRRLAIVTTAVVYLQILIGATMRHTGAGLAIPDFPLAFGRVVPPLDLLASPNVGVHFAHRVVALVTAGLILSITWRVWALHRSSPQLVRPALLGLLLVLVQIALGGLVVLSGRNAVINTAHVANGALVLATMVVLTLRACRPLLEVAAFRVQAPHAEGARG
jgi:heme a synthase